jgi:Holliday junction DNA helicase RuvA
LNAVEREELAALVKLPGIGKKTAERLIVEMKDRFKGCTAICLRRRRIWC